MKKLKKKNGWGKRGDLGKDNFKWVNGFDGLPNKWVLLGNLFIPICKNLKYLYTSIHERVWVNLIKWIDLPPILMRLYTFLVPYFCNGVFCPFKLPKCTSFIPVLIFIFIFTFNSKFELNWTKAKKKKLFLRYQNLFSEF